MVWLLRRGWKDSLTVKFRGLFQCFHGRHGACSVVRTLRRLRTSVAFGDRIMLCHWLLRLLLTPYHRCAERRCVERPLALHSRGPLVDSNGPHGCKLVPLFANLLSGTLLRQSLLHPASLTRLQVVGVTLHILNNVFRHNHAFEPPQGVLQRLAFLQSNFCHSHHPAEQFQSDT